MKATLATWRTRCGAGCNADLLLLAKIEFEGKKYYTKIVVNIISHETDPTFKKKKIV
jgi:hypothetical protein